MSHRCLVVPAGATGSTVRLRSAIYRCCCSLQPDSQLCPIPPRSAQAWQACTFLFSCTLGSTSKLIVDSRLYLEGVTRNSSVAALRAQRHLRRPLEFSAVCYGIPALAYSKVCWYWRLILLRGSESVVAQLHSCSDLDLQQGKTNLGQR